MRTFCFTVDDNIRFFKEITENRLESIFQHPYLLMYKRLHEKYSVKVQLNLFYKMEDFDLSRMPDAYMWEFVENSDWLKLSFHSDFENVRPYEASGYSEVYTDCKKVHDQILRFASRPALAKTTTVHYCRATQEGLRALSDNGVVGLLGLFGDEKSPRTSYELCDTDAALIRRGELVCRNGISFASIDIVLNRFSPESILNQLKALNGREGIRVMIHEQYFYQDYKSYQPNFEEKLETAFSFFKECGYKSAFFEDLLSK